MQQAKAKPHYLQLKNHQRELQPAIKEKPWESLIDKEERDKMWNTGYSLNSKQVTETLGFVDLK